MKPIRVGVIGLGMVAQIMHLPYLKEMEEFEIVGVCDASALLTEKVGEFYSVDFRCTDYRELVESDRVDAVLVLTFYHSDISAAAAAAGKHIFCEKPVAFSVREVDEIARAVDRAGVVFMIGYMKRFDDGYILGQKLFKQMSTDGDVRLIRVHDACFQNDLVIRSMYKLWKSDDVPPRVIRETSAKMEQRITEAVGSAPKFVRQAYRLLLETGSHDVNVLRGAFGEPRRVLSTEILPRGNWFVSVLDYGGEVRCVLDIARTARNWGDEVMTAYGMTRTVSVEFPNPFHKNAPTVVETIDMDGDAIIRRRIEASHSEAFRNELRHFAECIRKGRQPLTSLEEGLQDTELMVNIIKRFKK